MKKKLLSLLSILLVVALVGVMPINAYAYSATPNSQYNVVEKNGIRTVKDSVTGAIASYNMNTQILTVQENAHSEKIIIDLAEYCADNTSARSDSASSNNNEYAYSSTGNPALWTLQIPDQIKFTYERTQGALIAQFVANVDNLIEAEDNMIMLYGAGIIALLGIAVSGAIGAAIVAALGLGADVVAVINGLNSINTYKKNAETYFNRIVTYSTP